MVMMSFSRAAVLVGLLATAEGFSPQCSVGTDSSSQRGFALQQASTNEDGGPQSVVPYVMGQTTPAPISVYKHNLRAFGTATEDNVFAEHDRSDASPPVAAEEEKSNQSTRSHNGKLNQTFIPDMAMEAAAFARKKGIESELFASTDVDAESADESTSPHLAAAASPSPREEDFLRRKTMTYYAAKIAAARERTAETTRQIVARKRGRARENA